MLGLTLLLPIGSLNAMTQAAELAPRTPEPQPEPEPAVCGSCGAVKNENGELPCDH
ncbi:hypothetical protein [Paraburkholderia sp. GAS82]|uniref:hypothetical protein n=1 Tax=Paraburkholderia sp. GAS82 TaxID=3035137 RepID=UPI003D1AC231